MRALALAVLLVLVLVAVGWITFSRTADKASINVETQQIETDTQDAIDAGKDLAREAGDTLTGENDATEPVETAPTQPPQPVVPPVETGPEASDPISPPVDTNPAVPPQPVPAN
jgi:outer membrane biosynthesis protein TonB